MGKANGIGGYLAVAALCCCLAAAGCGRKTAPVPPESVVPVAIDSLRVELTAAGAQLSWGYPTRTTTGRKIEEIRGFEIYRAAVEAAQFCAGCPLPYGEPRTVEGGKLPPGGQPKVGHFQDALLRPGYHYFYRVRATTGWQYAGEPSNTVDFVWQSPPDVPEALTAEAGDGVVTLSWQAPRRHLDGSPADGGFVYRVLRREENGEWKTIAGPLPGYRFADITAVNGRSYSYVVQAARRQGEILIHGKDGGPIVARPRDLTPPLPPFGLVRTGQDLRWQPVPAADLAGYRIYRRCGDRVERVGEVGAEVTRLRVLPEEEFCFYRLTSFDAATPANESPPSVEIP
ncbi:MAG: fibronectin type III domain-containing protein [Thermodesulfobacteriota bacterium]